MKRANTDSVIIVKGIPNSKALIEVHLPVPFDPQCSKIFSTSASLSSSNLVKISPVISLNNFLTHQHSIL